MKFSNLLVVSMLLFLISCKSHENVAIIINNFSSVDIDSIVIPKSENLKKKTFIKKIKSQKSQKLRVEVDKIKLWKQGAFMIKVYSPNKTWETSWGFHDMGNIGKQEIINIYDNNVTQGNPILEKK